MLDAEYGGIFNDDLPYFITNSFTVLLSTELWIIASSIIPGFFVSRRQSAQLPFYLIPEMMKTFNHGSINCLRWTINRVLPSLGVQPGADDSFPNAVEAE